MKNKTEELNGYNVFPKSFQFHPFCYLPPTTPIQTQLCRSGTCWKRRTAEKCEGGDRAKARYGANMSKVRRWPGGKGSEFVLVKGRARCRVEREEKKGKNEREPVVG